MLAVSFSCLMFLACFLCFAFCHSLKLALRFILGASALPGFHLPFRLDYILPQIFPPLDDILSFHIALYYIMSHISSHLLLLLVPAVRRGFMARLRLRLCSCSMPSLCPLVASSAFALPFLICMLPLPFASLCSCPDASGPLFLSHVPCLLSVLCLLPFVEVGPALHSWSFCPSSFLRPVVAPPLHFILPCIISCITVSHIISYVAPPPSCGPSWLHGSSASQAVLLIHALYVSLGCLLCVCPAFSDLYAPLAFCFPLFLSWCLRSPFLVSCSLPAFSVLPFAARHTLVQPCLRTIDKCAKPFF